MASGSLGAPNILRKNSPLCDREHLAFRNQSYFSQHLGVKRSQELIKLKAEVHQRKIPYTSQQCWQPQSSWFKLIVFNGQCPGQYSPFLVLFLNFIDLFIYFQREGKGGKKKGRETSMCGFLSNAPQYNPGICPDWELNQTPFQFTGQHSIH